MTTPSAPRTAYTDAPELHPNPVLSSLQILFWLLFHPSAWRNYVIRADPTLRPDFCLIELDQVQWRNPHLQQVFVRGYLILPLLTALILDSGEFF